MDWLWQLDREAYRLIHVEWRQDWLNHLMVAITTTGLGWVQAIALIPFLWLQTTRRAAIAVFVAGAGAGLLRILLVRLIDRQRPSNFAWSTPLEDFFGHTSFPSGHTTTTFGIAFMLLLLCRETSRAWVGWLALVWACLVATSRIVVGVHYPTDVLGAAMLGCVAACLSWLVFERKGWLPA
ncbi:MAG TPA: phosphatase PAP2 family protein [Fimbriimonadaceae bacterium]|nr:phosphatase PAP2 family protein [Fimbriimonadaceae bacterium]